MNDPILPRKESRLLPSASILLFAAGIPLVLWLLYGRDDAAPDTFVGRVPAAAATTPTGLACETSIPNASLQNATTAPAAVAAALPPPPEIRTVKDLNTLADGPWPAAEKVRLLTAAARLTNPSTMPAEAARRLVWIVKDADYQTLMEPVLFDPQMPREVLEAIALNMHSRSPEVVKPLLERLAAAPDHPLHTEAAETLAFHRQAGTL